MIRIVIPGPPRGKGRPRFGNGRTFTDPKTESYEREVKMAGKDAMAGRAPLTGPLTVTIVADFAPPKSGTKAQVRGRLEGWIRPTGKPDADNIAKIMDGLNGIVWVDDSQVVSLHVDKRYSVTPQAEFTVEEWSLL
jgi:Holliday junction resolvase RusA-like endonuclease